MKDIIKWLENRGITVNDADLIRQAFMHTSYANEHRSRLDNERLEFMGDAVLQLWSSEHIFPLKPALSEGQMTKLRAQLVNEKALAAYGRQLQLNDYLLLGSGEEKTGGRNKNAIIADMFEAFLGALYLDQGMHAVDNILDEVVTPHPLFCFCLLYVVEYSLNENCNFCSCSIIFRIDCCRCFAFHKACAYCPVH